MDELVQSVVCYNARPLIFHGYLAPFFVLQAAIYYLYLSSSPTISDDINNETQTAQPNDEESRRHSYEIWVIFATVSVAAQIITYLFCHWSVDVKCWLSYTKCNDPYRAKFAKVTPTPNNGSTELVPIKRETVAKRQTLSFNFQKTKYVFDEKTQQFSSIEFPCDKPLAYYRDWKGYENPDELYLIDRLYGHNELEMVIPEFRELFIERATAPFFVFQIFCVGLWCLDDFMFYTLFTLFMLVTFEVVLVKHQLRNMQEIRRMGNQPYLLQVYRQNKWKTIRSDQLVSGDLVCIVRSEHNIPCDILLVRGSCIIDESTLTGESVPQMKESIGDIDDDDRRLDINQDKLHIIYGGTKVLQHTASGKDPGCVGYVLKTGFNTSQGKLLRTILFGVKRVTANNFETFCFIMFLLVFAIISAWYVWTNGIEDPKKSRYRLFFECTMIVTSVIPPELPIELSLAVNTSLISLSKLCIYCTEPFRIPFAGKVEYCCFDKTGTLTSDDLVVEGVAGLPPTETSDETNRIDDSNQEDTHSKVTNSMFSKHPMVTSINKCPTYTQQILASCHSLAYLDERLVGDPLEKKVLETINWTYSKSGTVMPKRGRSPPLKIQQRFHFNSLLKRMSVVSSLRMDMSNENVYICTSKGAPEFLKPLFKNLPENYDQVYLEMSRLGARVLALGFRTLGPLTHKELSELKREQVEKDLMFAGFLLISCPLKPDSKEVSLELSSSGHRLVMITGDGALTACHVASMLNFVDKPVLILSKSQDKGTEDSRKQSEFVKWTWLSTDLETRIDFDEQSSTSTQIAKFARKYNLCLTGDSLAFILSEQKPDLAYELICRVKVFARVSPKQKESIITTLKSKGKTVLMCGDGTNDVGALKHAHVGVALLSSSSVLSTPRPKPSPSISTQKASQPAGQLAMNANRVMTPEERRREKMLEAQMKLKQMLEEQDQPQFVKLGDASIAAPFTSRLSSTKCISHIIKQGRCTLVTTLQMFKILALNALLSAYCHSVLYLDGIKFSDAQVTLQGFLSTFCFLFITRSQVS